MSDQNHTGCWAQCRGGCSQRISREHILSKALLDSEMIRVAGFSWCKDGYKTVGINSLTVKALCKVHNNALSPVDEAGVFALRKIRELVTAPHAVDTRTTQPSRTVRVNGHLFERWLLKTAINTAYDDEYRIGVMAQQIGMPGPDLVSIAFGDVPFSHRMGLYAIVQEGSYLPTNSEITYMPITKAGAIGGWYIGIYGIDFFLSVFPLHPQASPPVHLRSIGLSNLPAHILDGALHYRVSNMALHRGTSHFRSIRIDWSV